MLKSGVLLSGRQRWLSKWVGTFISSEEVEGKQYYSVACGTKLQRAPVAGSKPASKDGGLSRETDWIMDYAKKSEPYLGLMNKRTCSPFVIKAVTCEFLTPENFIFLIQRFQSTGARNKPPRVKALCLSSHLQPSSSSSFAIW